jgi:hypothetical protein
VNASFHGFLLFISDDPPQIPGNILERKLLRIKIKTRERGADNW